MADAPEFSFFTTCPLWAADKGYLLQQPVSLTRSEGSIPSTVPSVRHLCSPNITVAGDLSIDSSMVPIRPSARSQLLIPRHGSPVTMGDVISWWRAIDVVSTLRALKNLLLLITKIGRWSCFNMNIPLHSSSYRRTKSRVCFLVATRFETKVAKNNVPMHQQRWGRGNTAQVDYVLLQRIKPLED